MNLKTLKSILYYMIILYTELIKYFCHIIQYLIIIIEGTYRKITLKKSIENISCAKICCRRFGGRFGRPFGFRGYHRSWQQSLHASRKSPIGAFTVARSSDYVCKVLRSDHQCTADQQKTTKTTNRFYSCSAGLSREKISLSEISQRGGPQ